MSAQPVDPPEEDPSAVLQVLSGVSLFDGSGFVSIAWGDERGQLTPEQARGLAMNVLQAAEGAENDAALVAELREGGVPDRVLGAVLTGIRRRRGECE